MASFYLKRSAGSRDGSPARLVGATRREGAADEVRWPKCVTEGVTGDGHALWVAPAPRRAPSGPPDRLLAAPGPVADPHLTIVGARTDDLNGVRWPLGCRDWAP